MKTLRPFDGKEWAVAGPFQIPGSLDAWLATEVDELSSTPTKLASIFGQQVKFEKVALERSFLDLRKLFGVMPGSPQAYAFMDFETPAHGVLSITFDADYFAAWRIDGEEVFDTKKGNAGAVGAARHSFNVVLEGGRHFVAVRLRSGSAGWGLILHSAVWSDEIPDELSETPSAHWRDYSKSVVRIEHRPTPDGSVDGLPVDVFEALEMNAGVDARWLSVFQDSNSSRYASVHLPSWSGMKPEHEKNIRDWVKAIHKRRMSAMSWLTLTENETAWRQHPDWRQQYLVAPEAGAPHGERMCCINSPYGEAIVRYAIEAVGKFDLDGVWFDGCDLSTTHVRPLPVSCVCPNCAKRFKKETGFEIPAKLDWSSPAFRRWIQWRYDNFAEFWTSLVDRLHEAHPHANVAFNHYHREGCGWSSGIPLAPFGKDFISGTEADGEPLRASLYAKFMRAYGRKDSEVWMGLGLKATPKGLRVKSRDAVDFALACVTAGAHASAGAGLPVIASVQKIADELNPRKSFIGLESIPCAALWISQQTETFVFGRDPAYTGQWIDRYWNSMMGWHNILAFAGIPSDAFFDSALDDCSFAKSQLVIAPFAVALKDSQLKALTSFVKKGGTLVTGPWFGVCDEFGEPAKTSRVDGKLFPWNEAFPGWEKLSIRKDFKLSLRGKKLCESDAFSCLDDGKIALEKAISTVKLGAGRVVQLPFDLGGVFRKQPRKEVVDLLGALLKKLAKPKIEIEGVEGALVGTFKDGKDALVAIQQFSPPWLEKETPCDSQPSPLHGAKLRWNGPKPKSVRCLLPEPGPELKLKKSGSSWTAEIPPFTWGQTLRVKV